MATKAKTSKRKSEKILLGRVGVDSGQLLVCDPCYIESQWKGGKVDTRRPYIIKETGEIVDMAKYLEKGLTYEDPLPDFGGRSMNRMLAEGLAEAVMPPDRQEFSYNGCCRVTGRKEKGGQLVYELGHEGAGVAFQSGCGDGFYEVWAHIREVPGWGRRIWKVEILM